MSILKKGSPLTFTVYAIVPGLILLGLFLLGNYDYSSGALALFSFGILYLFYLLVLGLVWWYLYHNWKYFVIIFLLVTGLITLWLFM